MASFLLPSIVLHDKSRHRLDFFLLEHKTFALIPAPRFFIFTHTAQRNFIRQMLSRESEQPSAEVLALIFRARRTIGRDKVWADAAPASPQAARHRWRQTGSSPSRSRAECARATSPAGNCLASSRPVEAQLSIQTRAISSYSSVRAGRIVGGGIQTVPDSGVAVSGAKKKPPRQYCGGFFNSIK